MGGAGKAAAMMADALVARYPDAVGCVVVPYGHGLPDGRRRTGQVDVIEAAHPVPDDGALQAGQRLLDIARSAGPDDRFVFLVSGGASALLEVPRPGIGLAEIQALNRCLLASGEDIRAINAVRRKLSLIKGGGLALAAAPAEILVLAVSDVPGDRLADIGSGPCSPDPTTQAEARATLARAGCALPSGLVALLDDPAKGPPPAGHPAFRAVQARIIARSDDAQRAVAGAAQAAGFTPLLLGSSINEPGEELARAHAARVRQRRSSRQPLALISGGETTVRLPPTPGLGGRNTTYLLRLALELAGADRIFALAADTDGIDGTGGHAGGWIGPDTLARGKVKGLDAEALLAQGDSYRFLAELGQLLVTGPTRTNVNDLRIILTDAG